MNHWVIGLTRRGLAALLVGLCPISPALAGPPYETDDPAPTDTGHWEVYVFSSIEGRGNDVTGAAGVDLNYGPFQGVQLTATLPVEYAHDKVAW